MVRMIDAAVNHSLPSLWNSEPTPAAPIVCEMVLSVRIAANGWSISSFSLLSLNPLFFSSLPSSSICDHVTDRIIASSNEQIKETPSARKMKSAIRHHCNSGFSNPSVTDVKAARKVTKSEPSFKGWKTIYLHKFPTWLSYYQLLITSDMICPSGP